MSTPTKDIRNINAGFRERVSTLSRELKTPSEQGGPSMVVVPMVERAPANVTRVLLADDHAIVREGLKALLSSNLEYQVVGEAVDGRDAVDKASSLKPDVVVLDVSMPDMNGIEAARRIATVAPETKVLILTMHESDYVAREALQAGARGFLLKSDAGRDLVYALDSLRQNKPFFSSRVAALVLKGFKGTAEGVPGRAPRGPMLTEREAEIVRLLADGQSSKEIASTLGISFKTVEAHRSNIMSKLGCHCVADLVRFAIRERIVEP